MHSFDVSRTSGKSVQTLWNVLADFPNIADWNPGVRASASTSVEPTGLGATRTCDVGPGAKLEETIREWHEPNRMVVTIDKAKMLPIKTASVEFSLNEAGTATEIGIKYSWEMKGGSFGNLFAPLMKMPLKKGMKGFLDSWHDAAQPVAV
jgi:hypothetical protein